MIGAMTFTGALPGFAATVTVFVGNTNLTGTAADVFVPPVTNINVGDQVIWDLGRKCPLHNQRHERDRG